jgi:hypothetical protein
MHRNKVGKMEPVAGWGKPHSSRGGGMAKGHALRGLVRLARLCNTNLDSSCTIPQCYQHL